jgi:hypothetical protein
MLLSICKKHTHHAPLLPIRALISHSFMCAKQMDDPFIAAAADKGYRQAQHQARGDKATRHAAAVVPAAGPRAGGWRRAAHAPPHSCCFGAWRSPHTTEPAECFWANVSGLAQAILLPSNVDALVITHQSVAPTNAPVV